jgi:hypothetical protein
MEMKWKNGNGSINLTQYINKRQKMQPFFRKSAFSPVSSGKIVQKPGRQVLPPLFQCAIMDGDSGYMV